MTKQIEITLGEEERLDEVNSGIRLIQNTKGLLYGTDALMLFEFMKPAPRERAAELGSGSGIISLLSARVGKFSHITAFDVQPYYASLTSRNAEINALDDTVEGICADVRSLGGEMCGRFGVVFSNPPYMGADNGRKNEDERKYIARHEAKGGVSDFVAAASRLLRFGGRAYFVMRPDRLTDMLASMRETGCEPKRMRFVFANVDSEPSMVLIEGVRGGKSGLIVEPPLIIDSKMQEGTE